MEKGSKRKKGSEENPEIIWQQVFILFIFETESCCVAQAHVQHDLSCNLHFPGSSNSHASAAWVAEITGMRHHAWLIFIFLVEMGFHHIGQAGLELLDSSDLPTLASQSAGITGIRHCTCPWSRLLNKIVGPWKFSEGRKKPSILLQRLRQWKESEKHWIYYDQACLLLMHSKPLVPLCISM